MGLISVKDYAKLHDISVQSVYQRISKGSLAYEIQDGSKMIKVKDNPGSGKNQSDCKAKVKILKAQIKLFKKEIQLLESSHRTAIDNMQKLLDMVLQIREINRPVIEAKVLKRKKKRKKKKRKSK
jgi:pyridoxal biosynthesis lyase PdxS